jgi:hypothetical protein
MDLASLLVEIVDPRVFPSLENAHLRPAFLPSASRARIATLAANAVLRFPSRSTRLLISDSDKLSSATHRVN